MSITRKTIDEITRTKTSVDGTERLPCRDDNGDFKISIANFSQYFSLLFVYPVGAFYIQYPSAEVNIIDASTLEQVFPAALNPAGIFGGTWEEVYEDEGSFFRSRGFHLEASENTNRTTGQQTDNIQGHWHERYVQGISGTFGGVAGSQLFESSNPALNLTLSSDDTIQDPIADGANGAPRFGKETYPVNRVIRIWRRTA